MLSAVILVLRESLEAALLTSFLLVYSTRLQFSFRWLAYAFLVAIPLAISLAHFLPEISNWREGSGQEILFALILAIVSLGLLTLNYLCSPVVWRRVRQRGQHRLIRDLMLLTIVCAITLEGSEVTVYLQSAGTQPGRLLPVMIGGLLGIGIGVSVGILTYYWAKCVKHSHLVIFVCLTLIAAGMSIQSVAYLIQGGLLDGGLPLWNSESLLSERSLLGQLCYALMGYESTPNAIQVMVYFTMLLSAALMQWSLRRVEQRENSVKTDLSEKR